MPVDLESRFKRLLREMITISNGIRDSALDHANDQNFDAFERLRRQLETIRVSADAILESFAKATLTSYALDDRMTDWLASGEPRLCLDKLKEMMDMLKPVEQVWDTQASSLPPPENIHTVATDFLDKHNDIFHFLLTPDVWNRERLVYLPPEASRVDRLAITHAHQETQTAESNAIMTTEVERQPPSGINREVTRVLKRDFLKQKLDEISRWLAPLECTRKHKDTLRLCQEGTCKWFPNTNVYKKWRTPGNRFLWLHGKGGCGKSVLTAFTIEYLKSTLKEEEVVIFFYCDFQNERSTSSSELMRSLLSQLLCHIRDNGTDTGDFSEKVLKQKSDGSLSLDDLGKLGSLVSRAASFFRYEPMIVIDALDECADLEALLPALVSLSQSEVRLLVTSRPDQTIMDHFAGLQSLSFENVTEEIAADIALHVRRELDSHGRLRPAVLEMKHEIDTKLSEKAEGRFRWVQCQLDSLKRCETRDELREALDSLPNELEATYERILGVIDERKSEGQLTRRVLALLMVAIEPLQLTQIVDGLSMDFQKRENDHRIQQWLETKLLHSLSSLVLYHEETDVLALAHYSVKEYLTSRSALPMYQIVTREAHAEVAQMCMSYISVFLKQVSSRGSVELWECFPMLFYALSSGFNHLAYVDFESTVALEALQSLGLDVRHYPSHWDRLCEMRDELLEWPYAPWPLSQHDFVLYILIAYSPPGLLRTFLSTHSLEPRIRTNPLIYAADLRKTQHAMVLLAHGADVNARSLVVDGTYRASPLEVAIDLGDDVLVGELLQRGCLVTSEHVATAVCMPWCSSGVLVKLMQTDEFVEWAFEIGDEKLYRGIFNSARPNAGDSKKIDEDHVALARRLCQLGVDISAETRFGIDLVERALHAAHTSMLDFLLLPDQPPPAKFLISASTGDTSETVPVVRFLLQKGVDIHAVSDSGDTALHLAAMCPWEPRSLELTRLLIDAGCSLHELNYDDESPLVVAMKRGHCSVMDFLLSHDAPLPHDILHLALAHHHRDARMVQFLMLKGASVHAIAGSRAETVLHAVLEKCQVCGINLNEDEEYEECTESMYFDLVNLFVEAGCNPNTRNLVGETVLDYAIKRRFASVVKLLLQSGASFPPDILRTALYRQWAIETIQLLVLKGADVHITTYGDTLLHLATREQSEPRRLDLVRTFMAAGCNPAARNSQGETIIEIATAREDVTLVELLALQSDVSFPPDILIYALCHRCTPRIIQLLVLKGANVHVATYSGNTILHLAIKMYSEKACCQFAKDFIDAGCDTTIRNLEGDTAIQVAIKRGYTSLTELLLESDSILFPPDILLFALWHGCPFHIIQLLILKGANMHVTLSNGDSALHLAIKKNPEETYYWLAKDFIGAGCDTTVCNLEGETAIQAAIECEHISLMELLLEPDSILLPPDILLFALWHGCPFHIIQLLILKGANLHVTLSNGDTPLHLAIKKYTEETCYLLAKDFIGAGCDTSIRNLEGETAIQTAIKCGYTSLTELLLESDSILFPADILLFALWHGCPSQTIQLLILKGANIHVTQSDGDTVLHLAVKKYPEETSYLLVKDFIGAGCDKTIHNFEGETAMQVAIKHGYTLVALELLLGSDSILFPLDILLFALWHCFPFEAIQFLILKGANVHVTLSDGDTVLHLAIKKYPEETSYLLVKDFISAGCDMAICNLKGETFVQAAMKCGCTWVAKLLLEFDILFPSDILLFALGHCCPFQMILHLVLKAANVHAITSDGDTALHLAINKYPEEACGRLVMGLINAGCNPAACNYEGKTALHAAIGHGYTSVINLLLQSDVPLPPDILQFALQCRFTTEMTQSQMSEADNVYCIASDLTMGEQSESNLVKTSITSGSDPATFQGEKVIQDPIERVGYTSAREFLLLLSNARFPQNILLLALQHHCSIEVIQFLILKGADVHATSSNGDTVLHLVITEYAEEACYCLMKNLIDAGYHPAVHSGHRTVLDVAVERGFNSVVKFLLQFDIPLPPSILPFALRHHWPFDMIQFLEHKGVDNANCGPIV